MRFASPLIPATLLKRYKRFLADVILNTGESVTAACPNTGAMLGLNEPGSTVYLSHSANPARKYAHTLELVEKPGHGLIGINTNRPNALLEEAITTGVIPALSGYESLRREVKYGENSRIDLLLQGAGRPACYVEAKNVTLYRRPRHAEFPDCATARGVKHLQELSAMVAQGHRAVMAYVIQGGDAKSFSLTPDLDPTYAAAFRLARAAGVEAIALTCHVSPDTLAITGEIPIQDT